MSITSIVFGDHEQFVAALVKKLEVVDDQATVLVYNTNSTLLKGELTDYQSIYEQAGCDILFSASAAFHYDDEVLRYYFWKFYPRVKSHYHYLDSNAFIGKAGAIKRLMRQIIEEYKDDFSWHDLVTRYYVEYMLKAINSTLKIKLDDTQVLFANVDGRRSAFKWPLRGWMHADLFLRKETALLQKIRQEKFQDKFWDLRIDKEGIAYHKQMNSPLIWMTNGGPDIKQSIDNQLKGSAAGKKGIVIYLNSLKAYFSSFFSFLFALIINRGETRPYRIFRYTANSNPEWQQTMQKFLAHLDRHEGFTFSHFNDGELTFIKKYINEDHAETWFGRRQQKYTKTLGAHLTKALKLDQPHYYVGVSCSVHHPRLRRIADELTSGQKNIVPAMSLHHNPRFFPNIIHHMKDRPVYFVKNEFQRLDVFEQLGVTIEEENQIVVPFKNSYLLFDELKDRTFPDGAIVILICGMLAKIIIPEWFQKNPNTTFIALGSSMDDFIQRTNTKFRLYPKEGLPLTCNIQPTKFFAFGWKKECKECWTMEESFDLDR